MSLLNWLRQNSNSGLVGFYRNSLVVGSVLAICALGLGFALALLGPLFSAIGIIVLALAFWALGSTENALTTIIAIVLLLPYGTLPYKVFLTLSFLDLAMVGVYGLYLGDWMVGKRRRLTVTPLHKYVLLFAILLIFTFAAGLRYAGLTPNRLRQMAEMMLSIGLVLLLVDMVTTFDNLRRIIRTLIVFGVIAAAIGIVQWMLPDEISQAVLVRLSPIGYPDSGVLHYVEDNPELAERAVGTAVDPNSFGGVLVIIGGIAAGQLAATRSIFGKTWASIAIVVLIGVCVGLTLSRGAMLAFVFALIVIGVLGDARVLWALIGGGIILMPFTQEYVARLSSGLQGTDLATQMRFGEIKDALILIGRYPLIGVGFTGAPDIDIYLGVSNLYLTIATNMGYIGLGSFLILFGAIAFYSWGARDYLQKRTEERSIWLGLLTGVGTVFVTGFFDHYFFNLEFFHASTMFWMCVGLLLAAARLARENKGVGKLHRTAYESKHPHVS